MVDRQAILFRADGNSEIGLGHLIRSSALASALKADYVCELATRCDNPEILDQISAEFETIIQLPQKSYSEEAENLASAFKDRLVILDGYNFDDRYQQILSAENCSFFCIDDIHAYPFLSKVIINHSGGLTPLDYQALPGTQFYLGLHYALLRKDFLKAAANRRQKIDSGNCLICFGGADPQNKTLEVLQNEKIAGDVRFKHFHVVVGSAYRFFDQLSGYCAGKENISLYRSLDLEDMIATMQKCSFAICSPSTVVYEYMSVGGVVFLEQIADNQKDVIHYMTGEGLAFPLELLGQVDEGSAAASLMKQANFFDGRSGERFRKLFAQYFDSRKLVIRRVVTSDIETCFIWANDPDVRSQSYNQNPIVHEDHVAWFMQKLNDPASYYYILEMEGRPVAQVRFQVSGSEAVISYLADQSIRSKGLGTSILSLGLEQFTREYGKPVNILGFVKENNLPSQRSFERLAFSKEKSSEYPGSFKYRMQYGN